MFELFKFAELGYRAFLGSNPGDESSMDGRAMKSRVGLHVVAILSLCSVIISQQGYAEESPSDSLIPDFYNDSMLSTSSLKLDDYESSSVDYFSGMMSRSATDVSLPGAGGFDLEVIRSYQSQQPYTWPERTAVGVGWNMHFGWVEITDIGKMCSPLWSVSVMDNPVIHMPDGSTDVLAMTDEPMLDPTVPHYRGKSGMGIVCGAVPAGEGMAGFILVGPDGRRYELEEWSAGGAVTGFFRTAKWFVKRITDRNGNSMAIDYGDVGGGDRLVVPTRVTASDGRVVTFEYSGSLLVGIRVGQQVVAAYRYQPSGSGASFSDLVGVTLQSDLEWQYAYSTKGDAGAGSMVSATNPFGGVTSYVWHQQYFQTGDERELNAAVAQVTQHSARSLTATWSYTYAPATTVGQRDHTYVSAPEGAYTYTHYSALGMVSGEVWRVGLNEGISFVPADGSPTRSDVFTWEGYCISPENYKRTKATGLYAAVDQDYWGPRLTGHRITIGSEEWSVSYDDWVWSPTHLGQPLAQTITTVSRQGRRTLNKRYFERPERFLFGLVKQEWVTQNLWQGYTPYSVDYDENGNITRKFDRGFYTYMTWDGEGNLATSTTGMNGDNTQGEARTTTFSRYFRGVAREVRHPDATTTERDVDGFGRITATTNREGVTTRYAYDGVGRVTYIDYPVGNDTSVSYFDNRTVLTRGDYRRESRMDGFGRMIEESHADTVSGRSIVSRHRYDNRGQVVFTSYPNSEVLGVHYSYDGYGRIREATHPRGTRTYQYMTGGRTAITNENGDVTTLYRDEAEGFGKGEIIRIESPEGIVTVIDRNEYGLPLRIAQGDGTAMIERTNTYNASLVLLSSHDPEVGETSFGYDYAGNLTVIRRNDGVNAPIDHQYNLYDLNDRLLTTWAPTNQIQMPDGEVQSHDARLEFSWSPEGRPIDQVRHETISYRRDGALYAQEHRSSAWHHEYDPNGNALVERATVDNQTYTFAYNWDGNDHLASMVYPDGHVLDYAPDAFGWPTQAGSYASDVQYHETGQLAGFTYGNGRRMTLSVNESFQVAGISVPGIADLLYGYDAVGNVTSIQDLAKVGENVILRYDGMNRLVEADGVWGSGSFVYDATGNIRQKSIGTDQATMGYDAANRLVGLNGSRIRQYGYDGFGNITRRDDVWFGYDGLGNLMSVKPLAGGARTDYQYDARGRRVATTRQGSRRISLQAGGDHLFYEHEPADNLWQRNIYLGNVLVARSESYIACWDDLDGDGIPHCAEQDAGLDPRDSTDAMGDRDGDALLNLEEYRIGTAINDADTDDDGLADGLEVAVGMDPKVSDADGDLDGDGLPNGVELARGFNPADPADGAADSDGDGLSNGNEYSLGTNWQVADTDADGMADGAEVMAGLNPLVADAADDRDGDGISNGVELAKGLDPNNPDDAQQDPDGDGVSTLVECQQGTNPFVADVLPPVDDVFVNAGGSIDVVGWVASPYAQSYTVDYGVLGLEGQQSSPTLTTTSFEHTGVIADTLYWYSVRARNAHGEVDGKRVVVMPGARQNYSIPIAMPSLTAERGGQAVQVAKGAGNSVFLATYDNYLNVLNLKVYRDGVVATQSINGEFCGQPCWQLVASESGDALLVWASNVPAQQVTYSAMRYSWADGAWGAVEQLAVLPAYYDGFVRAYADEYGNFRVAYTGNRRINNYYAGGYPRSTYTLYLASAYRNEPWVSRLMFDSGDALIGDVQFGSLTSLVMKEDRNTVQSGSGVTFTPEDRLYLMRQTGSSWSSYSFATYPSILSIDIDRNLLAYSVHSGPSAVIYAARICGDTCLQGNASALATTDIVDGLPRVFDGNGLGQVYWPKDGGLVYTKGATNRSGAFIWNTQPTVLASSTQFDRQSLTLVRKRSAASLMWGYNTMTYAEINAGGSWSIPAVIHSDKGVRAADMDIAGNLAYVTEANEYYSAYERQRLSSGIRYEEDVTPPVISESSVRSGKSTIKHVVTLTADEPANLFFRVTGGTITGGGANVTTEQRYTGPVTITFPKGGKATLTWLGINMAERWSAPASVDLQ